MTSCGYCGYSFDDVEAGRACAACELVGGGCKMVRCPRCGYEMPEEPAFVKKFRAWREGRKNRAQTPAKEMA